MEIYKEARFDDRRVKFDEATLANFNGIDAIFDRLRRIPRSCSMEGSEFDTEILAQPAPQKATYDALNRAAQIAE